MTNPLLPNQVDRLLPVLRHVAELVQKNGGLGREDLQLLLLASGLDEDWAVGELERWAKVLVVIQGQPDTAKRDIAARALMVRGVPEAPARLAVEAAAAPPPPAPTTLPIQVSATALGFGELQPGQDAHTSLTVSGGPGWTTIDSDMVTVHPPAFGPGATLLTVTVKGGLDGQVLWGALILESEAERVQVDLTARWAMAPEVIAEAPVMTSSPPPSMRPHTRPTQQRPTSRIRVTCPNCERRFRTRDSGELRCPECEWDFEVDEDGHVIAGVPLGVACPNCDHAFNVREAGDVECPECEWDFEVDEDGDVVVDA